MSETAPLTASGSAAGAQPGPEAGSADFWFDPLCPWAWITSRWMHEVEKVRPVTTNWRLMSLAYLNLRPDKEISDEYRARMEKAWGPVRICAAAAKESGEEILGPLYTAIGTKFHNEGRRGEDALREALAIAGLPDSLLAAAESDEFDDWIRASHDEGIDLVGQEVGTPVIRWKDFACFGPVVTPIPRGEAAGRLWDGFVLVAGTPGFYELKRTRTERPRFD
ncbi:MAG: mycothiol-dependent nitroreductase Rv2466c family protein [Acidimicrobiales bacterium]